MLLRSDGHLGCLGSVSPFLATSGGSAQRELLPLRHEQRKQERPLSALGRRGEPDSPR